MLDEYFPKAKVNMIKVDRHLLKKTDYDVKLTNGTKIEFSNKGRTNVDCKSKRVQLVCSKAIPYQPRQNMAGEKRAHSRPSLYYTVGLYRHNLNNRFGIFQGRAHPA